MRAVRIGGRAVRLVLAAGCLLQAAPAAGRPLVLELFTSQGCSSCPAADAILARLARTRQDILPLTFHVTYWNGLGWRDPFSLAAATERQRGYVASGVLAETYTPALVIDGRSGVVGSDEAAIRSGLASGMTEITGQVDIGMARHGAALDITVGSGAGQGSLILVGYDEEHRTQVGGGENDGRTLVEADVVRSVVMAGHWSAQAMRLRLTPPAGEHAALLLQAADGHFLGAVR